MYEINVLRRLQKKLLVAVPNPIYISPEKTYFGYPKLQGEVLESLTDTFSDEDWTQLSDIWSNVAATIHKEISVDEARALGVPDFDGNDTSLVEKLFEFSAISEEIVAFARKTIAQVKSVKMQDQKLAFIHNDMQFHNILADPVTKNMTGLIDWTDVCIAPIAREFATSEWMDRSRLNQVIDLYSQSTGVHVDPEQAIMWRAIEEISDFVEEMLGNEHEEAVKTYARIKRLISGGK